GQLTRDIEGGTPRHFAFQNKVMAAEICPAGHDTDDRVDDITHQRGDDGGERGTVDDADSHVHDIALGNEFLELFEHTLTFLVRQMKRPSKARPETKLPINEGSR